MIDPRDIYRGFALEEAAAATARGRKRTPLMVHDAWRQAIASGDSARFVDVVDVEGYTENCLGLTGWTTGFELALANRSVTCACPSVR